MRTIATILIAAAVLGSALRVFFRAPRHRIVCEALGMTLLFDALRAVIPFDRLATPMGSSTERLQLMFCMVGPAYSAYLYDGAFGPKAHEWITTAIAAPLIWVSLALPINDWDLLLPLAYMPAIAFAFCRISLHVLEGRSWSVTHRVAAMLAAGDIAGVMLYDREWVATQGLLVLLCVSAYQAHWCIQSMPKPDRPS